MPLKQKTKSIGIVQVKGGVGRSTLSTTLAGELAQGGDRVALIDCDLPQGTSGSWATLRELSGGKSVVTPYRAAGHRDLIALEQQLRGTVDWIVMDGPPRIAEMARAILALSNLALVPVSPSLPEVWATTDVLPLIEEAHRFRDGNLTVRLVWTRFRSYTRLAQDLEGQVLQELRLKPLQAHLGFRVAYAEALGSGLTGAETGDAAARAETHALISEVKHFFAKS